MRQLKNEREFQAWVRNTLKKCDCEVLNVHGHALQASGWPDLYFAHGMISGWLELKFKSGKLTYLQEIRIRRLRSKGVMAMVPRMDEDGFICIDGLTGEIITHHYKDLGPREFIDWLAQCWQIMRAYDMKRKVKDG